jgi:hypothetical protein
MLPPAASRHVKEYHTGSHAAGREAAARAMCSKQKDVRKADGVASMCEIVCEHRFVRVSSVQNLCSIEVLRTFQRQVSKMTRPMVAISKFPLLANQTRNNVLRS